MAEFEAACGAGVRFTEDQVRERAKQLVASHAAELTAARYTYPLASLLNELRTGEWAWAEGKVCKESLDAEVLALLGPVTAADEAAAADARDAKKKAGGKEKEREKEKGKPASSPAGGAAGGAPQGAAATGNLSAEDREAVFAARELTAARNSARLVEEHLAVTKGVVQTRFPPEPNGFLHIGHAKSMQLNFEGAFKVLGVEAGSTTFRYDDTNPDAESKEYIDNIAENVAWMGWVPARVTHSADYFPQLYEFALRLIRDGKAYVCHQTKAEMEASRVVARARDGRDPNSPWRDRPVEENLREFEDMRAGKFEEGAVTLRLKVDMTSPNPTLWDPVAYRIKFTPHPHTGDAWCIYPSYDFSHCIIDSLEHIDYSLCTLEFEVRRDLYYWILEQLDIWRPHVWEFARLNLTRTVLSKRRILKLVMEGRVRGWDDPRIATINGLRRRGYTPEAMNAFCREIGVTRHNNTIPMHRLEYHVRTQLDQIARRAFVVLRPLKVTLVNVASDQVFAITGVPDFPRDPAAGVHSLALSNVVYIERDDYRDVDDASYFGLAPGKTAGLRYAGYVKVVDVVRGPAGEAVELLAEYDHTRTGTAEKVKGNLHWVSSGVPGVHPQTAEVRLYDYMFTTDEPSPGDDWESELNPDSEVVLTGCLVDQSLTGPNAVKLLDRFQFERVGYFVADKDSNFAAGNLVFNQTVTLKESVATKAVRTVPRS